MKKSSIKSAWRGFVLYVPHAVLFFSGLFILRYDISFMNFSLEELLICPSGCALARHLDNLTCVEFKSNTHTIS